MKHKFKLGIAQIPLILGLLIMAIVVPVATRFIEEGNMDTRNKATTQYSCQLNGYSTDNCSGEPVIQLDPYSFDSDQSTPCSDATSPAVTYSSSRIICTEVSVGGTPTATGSPAQRGSECPVAFEGQYACSSPTSCVQCVNGYNVNSSRSLCPAPCYQAGATGSGTPTATATNTPGGVSNAVCTGDGNGSWCVNQTEGHNDYNSCVSSGGTFEPNSNCPEQDHVCCRLSAGSGGGADSGLKRFNVVAIDADGQSRWTKTACTGGKTSSAMDIRATVPSLAADWRCPDGSTVGGHVDMSAVAVGTNVTVELTPPVGTTCAQWEWRTDGGALPRQTGDGCVAVFTTETNAANNDWVRNLQFKMKTVAPTATATATLTTTPTLVPPPMASVSKTIEFDNTVSFLIGMSGVANGYFPWSSLAVQLNVSKGQCAGQSWSAADKVFGDTTGQLTASKRMHNYNTTALADGFYSYRARLSNGPDWSTFTTCDQFEVGATAAPTATHTPTPTNTSSPTPVPGGQACSTVGQWDSVNCRSCTTNNTWGAACSDQGSYVDSASAADRLKVCSCISRCNLSNPLPSMCEQFVLASPTGLTKSCSGQNATVSWNAVTNADYYSLRINKEPFDDWTGDNICNAAVGNICIENVKLATGGNSQTGLSYTFATEAGKQYQWWVHARRDNDANWKFNSPAVFGTNAVCGGAATLVTPRLYFASTPVASGNNMTFSYDYDGKNTTAQKMILNFYWRVKGTTAWTKINTLPRTGFDFRRTSMSKTLVADNLGKVYDVAIEAVVFNDTNSNGSLDSGEVFKRCSGREGLSTANDCLPDNMRELSVPAPSTTLTPTPTTAPGLAKQACCGACSATNSRIAATYDIGTSRLTASFPLAKNQNEADVVYGIECFYNDGGNEVQSMGVGTTTISGTTTTVNCVKDLPGTVGFNGNIYVYAKITTTKGTSTAVCDGTNGTCASCGQKTATIEGGPEPTNTVAPGETPPAACKPSLSTPANGAVLPNSGVDLDWENNCGGLTSRYVVQLADDEFGGSAMCSGALLPSVSSYSFTTYVAEHSYSWKVRKCNTWNCQEGCTDAGTNPWSDIWSFTLQQAADTPNSPTPTPSPDPAKACVIENVTCAAATANSVELGLTYNSVTNANIAGIKIQRDAVVVKQIAKSTTAYPTSIGDTGLSADTSYQYHAYCYGANGVAFTQSVKRVACKTAKVNVPTGCPNCVTNLKATPILRADGKYNVKLTWNDADQENGYNIEVNRMDGANWALLKKTTGINGNVVEWLDQTGYPVFKDLKYRVTPYTFAARDCPTLSCDPIELRISGGETETCAPTLLHPNDNQALRKEAVTMDWSSCGNDKKYKVVVTRKGTTNVVVQPVLGVGVSKYVFIDYQAGTSYDWKVGTCNDSNCSNPTYSTSRSFSIAADGGETPCSNECPSTFKCYKKAAEYRWFADGYVGDGYTLQAGVTTAAGCGNVVVPTFQGKRKGDANCDGKISLEDASSWRTEYISGDTGTVTKNNWLADFNCDQKVGTLDRSIWRDNYLSTQ